MVNVDLTLAECWLILHALACLTDKHPEDESEAMAFRVKLADLIEHQGLTV